MNIEKNLRENVYIMSVEGAEIYEYMNRDRFLKKEYIGMLPASLNLDKLLENKLKTFESSRYNKTMTNDIINVKFNQKVKSSEEIVKSLEEKSIANYEKEIAKLRKKYNKVINVTEKQEIEQEIEKQIKSKKKLEEYIKEVIKKDYKSASVEDLRTELYENGFTLEHEHPRTKKITKIEYVVYKRTSAKSRTSQVLFINKKLHNKMKKWARLGINLDDAKDVDYPSLLSYESLVDSSIEGRIEIDVDKILLVSDVKSIFNVNVNLVEKNEKTKLLESVNKPDFKMENDIFDGEGLLDSSYFAGDYKGKGMMLLRQHMFKCCVFNTNIQQFLQDWATDQGIDFDSWELEDMFGNKILAKNVYMITTPNSLKALKFSHKNKCDKVMYRHWKTKVKLENNIFGICKAEQESKRGYDKAKRTFSKAKINKLKIVEREEHKTVKSAYWTEYNIINQTSYQMLNSINFSKDDIEELSKFEVDYIYKLKNNDVTYVEYLRQSANDMNSNEMFADLYEQNKDIVATEIFKEKRKKDIHNYVKHIKKGKIRLSGDYCTIIQNGKELLYHAIKELPVSKDNILDYEAWADKMILKKNEVYTPLFSTDKEYVAFRNPHTSPSNVLIVQNKSNDFIDKYFNLTDNIVYTNAIDFEINRILSGQDVDSDNVIIFDNEIMLKKAKEVYADKKFKVCENGVKKTKNEYAVTNTDMAKIDNILSDSQKFIGEVVNLGQIYMSKYWDCINNGEQDQEKLDKLLQGIDICTVLSEVSIDMAKRLFDVDIAKQIRSLKKYLNKDLKDSKIPVFFKNVSKNSNIGNKVEYHETSVDYLYQILSSLKEAGTKTTVDINSLLVEKGITKVKKKQLDSIVEEIEKMSRELRSVEVKYKRKNEEDDMTEKYNEQDKILKEKFAVIKRYKITKTNMFAILHRVFTEDKEKQIHCKYKTELLNVLYKYNKDVFINAFKEFEEKVEEVEEEGQVAI